MAIAREAAAFKETSFAASITQALNNGSNSGRAVVGMFGNDNQTEHVTSATDAGTSCTLDTEEAWAGIANITGASLVGDGSVATGSQNFVGNYTDGNHKPGCIVAAYSGVGSLVTTARGHAENTTPSITITGIQSGDLCVAMFFMLGNSSATYTEGNGTKIAAGSGVGGSFGAVYVMVEFTATGTSATINGTMSATVDWLGVVFALRPAAGGPTAKPHHYYAQQRAQGH
jgi:hypothetical protein